MNCINILSKNLKKYRKVKQISQEELAKKCGMSARTYGKIERGDVNTSLRELDKLSMGTELRTAMLIDEVFEINE